MRDSLWSGAMLGAGIEQVKEAARTAGNGGRKDAAGVFGGREGRIGNVR